MTKNSITPLMQQYAKIKSQYPDTILLFQVGDFYELFHDDAKKAAAFLAIALTARGKDNGEPIPLCGVPIHAVDYYLAKLVKGGFKVALCNQLESPVPGKVVERGVVQVLTPATLTDSNLLDDKQASYLFSFFPMANSWGLLFGELLTGQIFATIIPNDAHKSLDAELGRFLPDEILVPQTNEGQAFATQFSKSGYSTTFAEFYHEQSSVNEWINAQFKKEAIAPALKNKSLLFALANFYGYLKKNQLSSLEQFKQFHFYNPEDYLILDSSTQRNLELVKNLQDGSRKNTLFELLDGAVTAMGSRMIRKWIMRPLIKKEAILDRQEALEAFIYDVTFLQKIKKRLQELGDIERVVGRICLWRSQFPDYLHLKRGLLALPRIKEILALKANCRLFSMIADQLGSFAPLAQLLDASLNDQPEKDWVIKKNFDQRLGRLRTLVENSENLILELEKKEQARTGINSLKIRYNNVHGYCFEVTKTHLKLVPDEYQRIQTLVGKERFATKELKELQSDIMTAKNQINEVEKEIFDAIKREVYQHSASLRKMANAFSHLDALLGLAYVSYQHGYTKPSFTADNSITIQEGRHPVIESELGANFIPNETELNDQQTLLIITGPNMGGKSTYLRQVALISVMAQVGSFVPCKSAKLSIRDRIFTRIGASDNVAGGKSTFLVEMEETASICHHATYRSLIILDEVGRGTSTYDGLAIAQAVVEYIAETLKARCLFATHYHELTELHKQYKTIVPFYASSKKTKEGILFLHKIVKGVADGSFGIEVARLAQLPSPIIARSEKLLEILHEQAVQVIPATKANSSDNADVMVGQKVRELEEKLKAKEEFFDKLRSLDLDSISPRMALDLLWKLRNEI